VGQFEAATHTQPMKTTPAQDLADAFYSLSELEFLRPQEKFPTQRALVRMLVARARGLEPKLFQTFVRELIRVVCSQCHDSANQEGALFRAFDGLDEVLEIDYRETKSMMPEGMSNERLYESGGVGVQTSYSTIMKVLERLQLNERAHLIDLGSGFGRVGLTTGLWREDLRFSGYEFVGHRVTSSNISAKRAGIESRVQFMQQDLSEANFQIPVADAYYLYDPFSVTTYAQVFARLSQVRIGQKTVVIAKDGARESFQQSMSSAEWWAPEILDEGSIYLFRSK
jgi:precorrin-6B methylase 2